MSQKNWTRPESVPFPSVWRRCQGKRKAVDGRTLQFKIQDITPDMHDDVIKHMETHFVRDELLNKCVSLQDDEVSMKEAREFWKKTLEQNVGLVALVEEEVPRIAGVNITGIANKDTKTSHEDFQGEALSKILRLVIDYVDCEVDAFALYGVDVYLTALGLSVDPEFRGQGLGLELLKARFDMGRALGLTVTVTAFTGVTSQALAHKLDFEVLTEVNYSDYKVNGVAIFKNDSTKSLKIMGKRIQ